MINTSKETIFALSTNYAQSAIAIIRISGSNCKKIAKMLCRLSNPKERYAHYCKIYDLESNIIDKGMVIFFKAPKSYTGENLLEIHIHGSIAIINKLTKTLEKIPKTRASLPGEFSKRAFMNGKGNMLYFEGINNLINAETENQRMIANKQIYGDSSEICYLWRESIIKYLSYVDAQIEFAEEINTTKNHDIKTSLAETIQDIENAYQSIIHSKNLIHGTSIMIIGPSNAGKSSLFNLLLQEERMIVSSIKGTTTDQTEQNIDIYGHKVKLIDSAGIRDTKNKIEKKGVSKTYETLKKIDKFILVLSPDCNTRENFQAINDLIGKLDKKQTIILFNKNDLKHSKIKFEEWYFKVPKIKTIKSFTISCKQNNYNHNMLKQLYEFIKKNLISVDTKFNDYYFSELRHKKCLERLLKNLKEAIQAIDDLEICAKYLRDALFDLDSLYGKHNDEDKLGIIFNKFCIGK